MKGFTKGKDGHWHRPMTGTYWEMVERGELPPPKKDKNDTLQRLLRSAKIK